MCNLGFGPKSTTLADDIQGKAMIKRITVSLSGLRNMSIRAIVFCLLFSGFHSYADETLRPEQ